MIRGLSIRNFYTSCAVNSKKTPKKAKSHSSHQWLARQMSDPFVELAKMKNYRFDFQSVLNEFVHFVLNFTFYNVRCIFRRCRSAFKLIEINDRSKILQPGQTVIDCGAAPGSWTEVAVNATNANAKIKNKPQGFVIGVDLLMIHPIEVGLHHFFENSITFSMNSPSKFFFSCFTGSANIESFGFH